MKRVLIVDDDMGILEGLAMALEENYEVAIAHGAKQALERLRFGEHFDVAVVDLMMPEMDGGTLIRELHALEQNLPVVLMSAAPIVGQVAQDSGALAYLSKPFSLDALETLLAGI